MILLVQISSVIFQAHALAAVIQSEEGGIVFPVIVVKVTVFHLSADRFVSLGVRHGVAGPYVDGAGGGCSRR